MCGLVGFFCPTGNLAANSNTVLNKQAACLMHRGPDDSGVWLDNDAGIALGHRRLAIIDPSPAGQQPMFSGSRRFVIAYNGEIYNHLAIRSELEAAHAVRGWRGHSDTETLLAGFDCWGVATTLKKANGMFAFALWDRELRELTLARDRMGEKPLFYGWQGNVFLFGSELKALRLHPAFRAEVDRGALTEFMSYGYIAAPGCIYRDIHKLDPGKFITICAKDAPGHLPQPHAYWSLREVARCGLEQPFVGDDEEAIALLDAELRDAVLRQTISDVPLGAFLSGGTDSSTVVALLQAQSSRPVKTFSIGFHEAEYQEAQHAAVVARHLRTDHSELYVTAADAMRVIPKLPSMYDEPFGDSSAIPTHLVAEFASGQVRVCLSGDGGDELFGGYTRYQSTDEIWRRVRRIPAFARSLLKSGCAAYARSLPQSRSAWRAERFALYLASHGAEQCYATKILQWPNVEELVLGHRSIDPSVAASAPVGSQVAHDDIYARMMYRDTMTYLPDDILAKVDRAAMAVSLETRIPLIDHRIVELSWRLPLHMKIRNGESKWLLKQVLARYVPRSLTDRPKMGFGVPVGEWIRGPLRDWAEELLSEHRLRREGFLNPSVVRGQWARHLSRASDAAESMWQVLMFQAWLESHGAAQSMQDGVIARSPAAQSCSTD